MKVRESNESASFSSHLCGLPSPFPLHMLFPSSPFLLLNFLFTHVPSSSSFLLYSLLLLSFLPLLFHILSVFFHSLLSVFSPIFLFSSPPVSSFFPLCLIIPSFLPSCLYLLSPSACLLLPLSITEGARGEGCRSDVIKATVGSLLNQMHHGA